jgi:hypothetical protein
MDEYLKTKLDLPCSNKQTNKQTNLGLNLWSSAVETVSWFSGIRHKAATAKMIFKLEGMRCEPDCILWLTDWSHYLNF